MPRRLSHCLPRAAGLLCACALAACAKGPPPPVVAGGDGERGRAAIERYGCVACHTIPGVQSYGANVGPPLGELAGRAYLAGVLPNTPGNLVRWLQDPPAIAPRTAMPSLGITAAEAADIAAFLYAAK